MSAFNPWNRGLLTAWSTCIYLLTGVGAQVQFRIQKVFSAITMLIILSRESAYNTKYDPSENPSRSHAGMSFRTWIRSGLYWHSITCCLHVPWYQKDFQEHACLIIMFRVMLLYVDKTSGMLRLLPLILIYNYFKMWRENDKMNTARVLRSYYSY